MWQLVHKEVWVLKNWCFLIVVLEKILKSPLDNKEIKPVILKEISPEYSLEGLMLKLQYFGHQMQRADSLEKTKSTRKKRWPKYWSFSISPSNDFKHQVLQGWFPYRRKYNIHEGSLSPQEEDEFRENKTWKGWLFWLWEDTFGIFQN